MGSHASRPAPRQVGTWQQAEELAVDWMRWLGSVDARLTNAGPDGGIDVTATDALAQVKFKASQVGAPELQRLYGARAAQTNKTLLFFTGTGYSKSAVEYATANSMALFTYTLVGDLLPANSHARSLVDDAERTHAAQSAGGSVFRPRQGSAAGAGGRGPVENSPRPVRARRSPVARGVIAALLMFLPATLALVGLGALTQDPEHPGAALQVGLLGVVAYIAGLWLIAGATAPVRRQSRTAGLLLTLLTAGPGIAIWIALAFSLDADTGGRAPLLFISAGMVAPLVVVGLLPRYNPDARLSDRAGR